MRSLEKLTNNARSVLLNSYELAKNSRSKKVRPDHIFIAILDSKKCVAARLLMALGVDLDMTRKSVIGTQDRSFVPSLGSLKLSKEFKTVLRNAFMSAHKLGHVYVGTEHLLLGLLQEEDLKFVKELISAGLSFESVKNKIVAFGTYPPGILMRPSEKTGEIEGSAISAFGQDLTQMAAKGDLLPIIGREEEIERLIHILARRTKNNPILIGEAGVGKTAVVEGLAQRIVEGKVPDSMRQARIVLINVASIVAGSRIRGDIEERLLALVSELKKDSKAIVFIDEIHTIIGAGSAGASGGMDIANILKPSLVDGSLRFIGATTLSEYRKYFEDDAALTRRFQPIFVTEISTDDSKKILDALKKSFEKYHNVRIADDAIETAVKLSDRYVNDRFLPDKAIDLIDEAAAAEKIGREVDFAGSGDLKSKLTKLARLKETAVDKGSFREAAKLRARERSVKKDLKNLDALQKAESKKGRYLVDNEKVKKVISRWTGIPITTMTTSDIHSLKNVERALTRRVVGQANAVKKVAAALKRARVGIADATRPLSTFLFLGPTGVGKTELAKVVAEELFGHQDALVQVDMSEFMEQHSVSKFIGSPPGYIGYDEGGQLTERVRRRPYSVILFDEIEKAHPDVLNILLQILEEGKLTDAKGRVVNFKNTIIILTSNIGAEEIGSDSKLGFDLGISEADKGEEIEPAYEEMEGRLMEELKESLRPEFLNRLDEIIIFRGLDLGDARKIVRLLLADLNERLKEKGVEINVGQSAVNSIAKEGFSEEYGARPLRRKIQELVETPIAEMILDKGESLGTVRVKKDKKGSLDFVMAK